jgi:hypothetical protein
MFSLAASTPAEHTLVIFQIAPLCDFAAELRVRSGPTTLKQLLDRAFDPERMQAATKRLDRVFDVYSLERRRHSVTRVLDIGVPSLLMLLVLVCAGTSFVRWPLGLSW